MSKTSLHISKTPATQPLRHHKLAFSEHVGDYVERGGTAGDVPGQARFIASIPGRGDSFVEKVSFLTGPDVGDSVDAFNGEL